MDMREQSQLRHDVVRGINIVHSKQQDGFRVELRSPDRASLSVEPGTAIEDELDFLHDVPCDQQDSALAALCERLFGDFRQDLRKVGVRRVSFPNGLSCRFP